jgi:uncharacterized membrane protein YpjA
MKDLVLSVLVIGNCLAFLTFAYFYGPQIQQTNPLLWIFIPDCQLAALFFAITGSLILAGKENDCMTQLGIASSIKYGLWTLIVLLGNIGYYLNINPETLFILITGHIILFLQTVLIFNKFKLSKESIPAFTYLFLNDASDYLLGTHPPVPPGFLGITTIITPLITIGLILVSYLNKVKGGKE